MPSGLAPRIRSFEPGRGSLVKLKETAAKIKFTDKITIIHKAVSSKPGSVSFDMQDGTSENAHMVPGGAEHSPNMYTIPVTTVSDEFRSEGVAHLDLLKIDTEGFEKLVLLGAEQILKEQKVSVILFEYGLNWFQYTVSSVNGQPLLKDMVSFLDKLQYDVFYATPGSLIFLNDWDDMFEMPNGLTLNSNIICLSRGWPAKDAFVKEWPQAPGKADSRNGLAPICPTGQAYCPSVAATMQQRDSISVCASHNCVLKNISVCVAQLHPSQQK
jgi:FkbM family methyltransferase